MRLQYLLPLIAVSFLLNSCSKPRSDQFQGYIEGRYTYVATSESGDLIELAVKRGDWVKAGQLLFKLEPQPESDMVKNASENLNQAYAARDATVANLKFAKQTYERYKVLVPQNAVQQSLLDNAKSNYDATTAQLQQAEATIAANKATLAQANWSLQQKQITAPVDALVFDTYYRLGEYTIANQAVLSLLAPADIKVIFYVREGVLGGLKIGDKVSIHCDGCVKDYPATISFISPTAEYTPPVIYSNQTSAKLLFRLEAVFTPEDAKNMHPGQPAMVTHTHG